MAKIGTCVYPNPALNELHIGGVGIEADLVVSDMKGAVLLVGKGTKMDISGLASGLYMLSVSSDGKTERFKIVKQ